MLTMNRLNHKKVMDKLIMQIQM